MELVDYVPYIFGGVCAIMGAAVGLGIYFFIRWFRKNNDELDDADDHLSMIKSRIKTEFPKIIIDDQKTDKK